MFYGGLGCKVQQHNLWSLTQFWFLIIIIPLQKTQIACDSVM